MILPFKQVSFWVIFGIAGLLVPLWGMYNGELAPIEGNVWAAVELANMNFLLTLVVLGPLAAWFGSTASARGIGISEGYSARPSWHTAALWILPAGFATAIAQALSIGFYAVWVWEPGTDLFSATGSAVVGIAAAFSIGTLGAFLGRFLGPTIGPLAAIIACGIIYTGLLANPDFAPRSQTDLSPAGGWWLLPSHPYYSPATVVPTSRAVAVCVFVACLTVLWIAAAALWSKLLAQGRYVREVVASIVALGASLAFGVVMSNTAGAVARTGVDPVCESVTGPAGDSRICVWPERQTILEKYTQFAPTVLQLREEAGLPTADYTEPGLLSDAVIIDGASAEDEYILATAFVRDVAGFSYTTCSRATVAEMDWAATWALDQMLGYRDMRHDPPPQDFEGLDEMSDSEQAAWREQRMPDIAWCLQQEQQAANVGGL